MNDTNVDVLIIGAGPSGCVSASYLHAQGFHVKVVEKSKFPRFVIGESLLPRCMDHFEETGLLDCLKQFGFEVKSGARFIKGDTICEFDFSKKHTQGWNWTWQVPRADFDNVLAKELVKKGIDVSFEHEVIDVVFNDNGSSKITLKNADNKTVIIDARYIIDFSGYGRILPRLLNLDTPSGLDNYSSIFTHINDTKRPEGKEGTFITFDVIDTQTWFWVIPFSNGVTSIGYVGPTTFIESFKGTTSDRLNRMIKLSKYYSKRFESSEF